MKSDLFLRPQDCVILSVDMQERLAKVMSVAELGRAQMRIQSLFVLAQSMGIPVIISEQYPKGLGPTLPGLREVLPPHSKVFEKIEFSAMANERIAQAMDDQPRRQVILVGMETHVCIFQTARDLCQQGWVVHIPADAVLSRHTEDLHQGLRLCEQSGAVITRTETVLYDLIHQAGTPLFKQVAALCKAFDQQYRLE